ncbi:MAG: histidinol phosphatase, partial [Clostridia bacterium]|nr:histidinol phosphatase [Clostridia bacterium]
LDYLILGNHFADPESAGIYFGGARDTASVVDYVRATVKGMETGAFDCLAHPDVVLQMMPAWNDTIADAMRELCRAAKALHMPLEYNLLGLIYGRLDSRKGCLCYPNPRFWEIAAAEGCTAIVGLDAHQTAHMTQAQEYDEAYAYLESLGMPCIQELPL